MNIKSKYLFLLTFLLVWPINIFVFPQDNFVNSTNNRGDIRIMFYNVENYFDIYNDSLFADEEFLPGNDKNWNYSRYKEKTLHLFKTIAAVGENRPPEIICFAEIENKNVLYELAKNTPLEKYDFEIEHFESPDFRGIDVGLIYRSDIIRKLSSQKIHVSFPSDPHRTTRDILYFKGLTEKSDTLHLFVNHWPSRRGGQIASAPRRMAAARVLKRKTDSIISINPCANIVITGDFNDEPHDESLRTGLSASTQHEDQKCGVLYNISGSLLETCQCGTYRYRAHWNMLDQFIVSGKLLISETGLRTCTECLYIAEFDFLLIEDEKYGGVKPFRTYQGPVYKAGFSDHLPVFLDLFY